MKSLFFALSIALGLGVATSRASIVSAGFDLFDTIAADTNFPGLGNLMGVPLGTFNFGGTVGVQNTGSTDTILQRLASATVASPPGTAPAINIQVAALQLETVAPVNFMGDGLANYFITLQSTHGGPASNGTETITFASNNGGTFNSSLDLFFDIRMGSLTGPIVESTDVVLTNSGTAWGRTPPAGAVLINGANNLLDATDHNQDIFTGALLDCPNFCAAESPAPEPSTLWPLSAGLFCTIVFIKFTRRTR